MWKRILFLILLSAAFLFLCAGCGDDDDDNDDNDDDPDDVDDDDDDTDDDDDSHTGAVCEEEPSPDGLIIERLEGGIPGRLGLQAVFTPGGELYAAAVGGRALRIYRIAGGAIADDQIIAELAQAPSLATDAEGNLHVAYVNANTLELYYATNESGNWQSEPIGDGGSFTAIVMDDGGAAHIAFNMASFDEEDGEVNAGLFYATNTSGSWATETLYNTDIDTLGADIALDPQGHVHLVFLDSYYMQEQSTYYVYATFYGTNAGGEWEWETLGSSEDSFGYPQIEADATGTIHLYGHGGYQTRSATKKNDITPLDLDDNNAEYSSLVVSDDGQHIAIAFYARTDDPDDGYARELRWTVYQESDWEEEVIVEVGYFTETYAPLTALYDAEGNPAVVFYNPKSRLLEVAEKPAETWSVNTLTENEESGVYYAVAGDAQGGAHVAFHHLAQSELRYGERTENGWEIETVDETFYGGGIGLAVDSQMNVWLAYAGEDIIVARKTADGWDKENVVDGNFGSHGVALIIDENDALHMAYLSGRLYYATNASGAWESEEVEIAGDSLYTSSFANLGIAVDDQGRVFIAYYNQDEHTLNTAIKENGEWVIAVVADEISSGIFSMASNPNGDPRLAYGPHYLNYAVYQNDLWISTEELKYSGLGGGSAQELSMVLDGDGMAHLAFNHMGNAHIDYLMQTADGWRRAYIDRIAWCFKYSNNIIDVDGQNNVHMIYANDEALYYATFPQWGE